MKIRLFFVMGLTCLMYTQTFALSFMGPPTAELNRGQFSVGYIYSYSVQDLDKVSENWSVINDGVITSTGKDQLKIEDLSVQRHYIGINCGLMDWWEIYGRIGLSDVKGDVHLFGQEQESGYNFDNDFAGGWGTKITFKKNDTVAWGASLHMNWLDTSTSTTEYIFGSGVRKDNVNIRTYDILLAVGPTINMGGWKLYGGPFYYSLDGHYDREQNLFGLNYIEKEDANIQEGSDFGAFVGAVVDLSENSDLTTELSFTSEGWALGTGIAKKF
jgi:hypothetical protein